MDENLELEQDIDTEDTDFINDNKAEDNSDDVNDFDDDEEVDSEDEEELEYDDDGNVVESNTDDDGNDAAAQVEERDTKETDIAFSKNVEDREKKLTEREAIIRDALKAMGIEEDDIDKGLAQLAADAKGVTVEEYTKKRAEAIKQAEAQRVYREVMLKKMIDSDMNALHSLFPETKSITKFEEIPNARRYAELRDLGLNPKEAYSAANPEARREAVAASVKQQAINASKSHLKSNVPIGAKDNSVKISKSEMEMYREMFRGKTDQEIIALYKKTR